MTGEVVKANFYTIWVNVEFKKKVMEKVDKKLKEVFKPYYKTIKRHKVKHAVVIGV
jgi:formylmethanofuran dehydrogenase subunit A